MANVGTNTAGKVLTARGVTVNSGFLDIGSLSGLTDNGVVIANGNSAFTATAAGTNGTVLMGNTGAEPSFQTGGSTFATTYTADSGSATPSAGNLNVLGQQAGSIPVMDTIGSGSTLNVEDRTRPSTFVVDPSTTVGLRGTYSTIQSAITAASAGDTIIIRPGTYTENITLKLGVSLIGFVPKGANGNRTTIVGKMIDNGSVASCTISNINLKTNADYFLSLTAATTVTIDNCRLDCSDNTGISAASGSTVNVRNCTGDLGTTGIGFSTGAGSVYYSYCSFSNSGGSTAATTTSGVLLFNYGDIASPLSTSGAGVISAFNSVIDTNVQNTTAITTAGTGSTIKFNCCTIISGSASALSIGSGTTVALSKSVVNSTNTNPVTGAGTYKSDDTTYSNTGVLPNPTTETFAQVGRYGTWTPTLDGATPGSTTYTTQVGQYHRIGNLVWIQGQITITAATGTGNAIIGGLPFTIKNVTSGSPIGTIRASNATWAWPASTTHQVLTGTINSTTCLIVCTASSQNPSNLQMTNGAITMIFTMVYEAA